MPTSGERDGPRAGRGTGGKWITLTPAARRYPSALRAIYDPPALLHVRGSIDDVPAVAVVGSRRCSPYGREVATQLAVDLVAAGLVVVSGLARGIDRAAHRGALEAGGRTWAVLPCGPDRIYPAAHRALADAIARDGALVTDFPPGTEVARWNFPIRNRIIAGLALVTVVVEAAQRSGARLTANLAIDAGREVLVVPGPVTSPTSRGCNQLLAQGAHVCAGWRDVLEHLPPEVARRANETAAAAREPPAVEPPDLPPGAAEVLAALRESGTLGLHELVAATGRGVSEVLSGVTALEVRGLIRTARGDRYEPRGGSPDDWERRARRRESARETDPGPRGDRPGNESTPTGRDP